jgi:hypothetical protein|tara:strand:+ start:67 stop:633 length:567 start_codon:yes stop_codon:yes gene_type:complete
MEGKRLFRATMGRLALLGFGSLVGLGIIKYGLDDGREGNVNDVQQISYNENFEGSSLGHLEVLSNETDHKDKEQVTDYDYPGNFNGYIGDSWYSLNRDGEGTELSVTKPYDLGESCFYYSDRNNDNSVERFAIVNDQEGISWTEERFSNGKSLFNPTYDQEFVDSIYSGMITKIAEFKLTKQENEKAK